MLISLQLSLSDKESDTFSKSLRRHSISPYSVEYSKRQFGIESKKIAVALPLYLREAIGIFLKKRPFYDLLSIQNCPIDRNLPPTPNIEFKSSLKNSVLSETLLLSISSVLGSPFAIDRENKGFLIHNIYPVSGYEDKQSSKSSSVLLTAHTELSCLTRPPDYLMLLGLRESGRVATQFIKLDDMLQGLSAEEIKILRAPLYVTELDESLRSNGSQIKTSSFPILGYEHNMNIWRYDVEYTRGTTLASKNVIRKISRLYDKFLCSVVIGSGDLVIVDNKKVAHARTSFKASYDGTDRWIQRVNLYKGVAKNYYSTDEIVAI